MKRLLLLTLLFAGFTSALLAQDQQVKYAKYTVDLRSGPGAYYDFVSRIFANAQVKPIAVESGWQQIQLDEQTGWVPASALQDTPKSTSQKSNNMLDRMNVMFGEMSSNPGAQNLTASKAEVAAAVKGFARKYKANKGKPSNLNLTPHMENRINWANYKRFRKSRVSDSRWYNRKVDLRLDMDDVPAHDPTLDQSGFAIASVLASDGLYQDQQVLEYVNYMALMIVESSHRDETPVQVHILNSDEVLGYAIPGGYIFISKGALRLMQNEAELAHFLAHEIAHLTFEHGMQEYEKRRPRVHSAKAFEDLDRELADEDSTKYTAVDEELSAWTDEVYDYISKPRLEDYETEADYWGLVYAFRAGYAPEEAIDYLARLKGSGTDFQRNRGSMEWTGTPLEKRIRAMQKSLKKLRINGGETYTREFKEMQARIR
ncbi:hypothetical protein EP331_14325 [bacterium]|nr:MAG: hypothetical protein EP331_14325 [bacterium]